MEERLCQLSRLTARRVPTKVPTRSGGCQNMEGHRRLPHVLPAPRRSRNMLAHPESAAMEVAQFVVASANSVPPTRAFQSQHRPTSAFDAAMVLLKSVVEIATRPMSHLPTELGPDRSGIGVMAVCRDPVRRDIGDRLGGSKECLGSGKIAVLAQHDIDRRAVAIDCRIQIPPLVRLIDIYPCSQGAWGFCLPTKWKAPKIRVRISSR